MLFFLCELQIILYFVQLLTYFPEIPREEGKAATILIGEGEYHETVNVTRKAPLTLLVLPQIS